jgi:hypothetical protein
MSPHQGFRVLDPLVHSCLLDGENVLSAQVQAWQQSNAMHGATRVSCVCARVFRCGLSRLGQIMHCYCQPTLWTTNIANCSRAVNTCARLSCINADGAVPSSKAVKRAHTSLFSHAHGADWSAPHRILAEVSTQKLLCVMIRRIRKAVRSNSIHPCVQDIHKLVTPWR